MLSAKPRYWIVRTEPEQVSVKLTILEVSARVGCSLLARLLG